MRDQQSLTSISIVCFQILMPKLFTAVLTAAFFFSPLAGMGVPAQAADSLEYRKPSNVPASWTRYGQLVQYMLGEWLSDGSTEASRLHDFLQHRLLDTEADAPPENRLPLSLWIDRQGNIKKAAFAPLGNPQADSDLRTLLQDRSLSEAPPQDMLMPLRLNLRLDWRD
ncbi:hypothetical protein ACSHT0_16115 [Tepidicaulis sp. LMO-SS28]|uniref:hypothetical protein n=1 Tax=Tepidicaulis sp. LMO-SS28 TaxID=3447455 RepID=UPI003EDFE3C0